MNTTSDPLADLLSDRSIDDAEVPAIREHLYRDGRLNLDDVRTLVELYCGAREFGQAFEDLFFSVLEQVILADGEIQPAEQFYLLKMLYSDRRIRDREKAFLHELRRKAKHVAPEFEALYREAMRAHPTDWSVGGR